MYTHTPAKDKYQLGAKFKKRPFPVATESFAIIKGVHVVDGKTFITFQFETKSPGSAALRGVATYEEKDFLYFYEKVEEFFVVGGEYKSRYSDHTYYVQEIFTISNPITQDYRKQARAVVINGKGKRHMEMLSIGDFDGLERIK